MCDVCLQAGFENDSKHSVQVDVEWLTLQSGIFSSRVCCLLRSPSEYSACGTNEVMFLCGLKTATVYFVLGASGEKLLCKLMSGTTSDLPWVTFFGATK